MIPDISVPTIRAPKDFWTGVMFIAIAAVALYAGRGYSLGTAVRMGPGYFPMLLGSLLALIGLINFDIVSMTAPYGCEFIVHLRKRASDPSAQGHLAGRRDR